MSGTSSEWTGSSPQIGRERGSIVEWPSSGLLLTGLAVVAVGALAWYYLGPDLIRYMKIRDM